ncbi:MAG: hypothetical protein DWQ47_12435 [Acidobacteria bacterium]|nr:MAG: hypothetical protein DWQ32_14850 [Acidobacteriota bacterium]REJ98376.1 MAG: hypothetical protein DWQ38_17650 [Acidobacteriota bacterium]REK17120.1 MAG: hypothetical protein DWQ43_02695 [Acidobacteriota bacterium]REK43030.1 MAG: hypothetical protein DWQ47_12435 [Acidobacteriota bacterium]
MFRRKSKINNPYYDRKNDVLYIDFSIEETSAVLQLLESKKPANLELKNQDGRIWVELYV